MPDASRKRVLRDYLDDAFKWSCGFSELPTDPACMVPARWHGIIDDQKIDAAMSCCDKHLDAMTRSADYVHEMGSACFLPGSMFDPDENECFLPDEDGAHALLGHEALPIPVHQSDVGGLTMPRTISMPMSPAHSRTIATSRWEKVSWQRTGTDRIRSPRTGPFTSVILNLSGKRTETATSTLGEAARSCAPRTRRLTDRGRRNSESMTCSGSG